MFKCVVVAATGGVGRHLLTRALTAGYDVTAVVRNPDWLVDSPARVIQCDLAHPVPNALEDAVAGADVVLSALGARTAAQAGVASRGT